MHMIKVNIHFLLWSFDREKNQDSPVWLLAVLLLQTRQKNSLRRVLSLSIHCTDFFWIILEFWRSSLQILIYALSLQPSCLQPGFMLSAFILLQPSRLSMASFLICMACLVLTCLDELVAHFRVFFMSGFWASDTLWDAQLGWIGGSWKMRKL